MPTTNQGKIIVSGAVIVGTGVIGYGLYYLSKGNKGLSPETKKEMKKQQVQLGNAGKTTNTQDEIEKRINDFAQRAQMLVDENTQLKQENKGLKEFQQALNSRGTIPASQIIENVLYYGPIMRNLQQFALNNFTPEQLKTYNGFNRLNDQLGAIQAWFIGIVSEVKKDETKI